MVTLSKVSSQTMSHVIALTLHVLSVVLTVTAGYGMLKSHEWFKDRSRRHCRDSSHLVEQSTFLLARTWGEFTWDNGGRCGTSFQNTHKLLHFNLSLDPSPLQCSFFLRNFATHISAQAWDVTLCTPHRNTSNATAHL